MTAPAISDRLEVTLFGRYVGDLTIAGPLRSPEDWTFTYRPEALHGPHPVALSVSLPLQDAPLHGARVRNWFCNLLPEGAVREAIAARLRLPQRDDFGLLAAIGGECAGAVSLRAPGAPPAKAPAEPADLDTLLWMHGEHLGEGAWALLGTPLRLSLAGAQDKIAVIRDADGRLRLPEAGESTTHILKPDSRRFPGLRDYEALGLALAHAAGLQAAHAEPMDTAHGPALLIQRYDRHRATDGSLQRLHQEDFCQALGYPPELKYQGQGGPGLAQCSTLLRSLALGPGALQGLLDWVVFNALIGNADAHAKNLALLCDPTGRRRLAPFYDLVPTIALPESLVDPTPALRIGAARRIDAVTADDWRTFAREAGYAAGFVLARVTALAGRIRLTMPDTCKALAAQGCDVNRLQRAADAIMTRLPQ